MEDIPIVHVLINGSKQSEFIQTQRRLHSPFIEPEHFCSALMPLVTVCTLFGGPLVTFASPFIKVNFLTNLTTILGAKYNVL